MARKDATQQKENGREKETAGSVSSSSPSEALVGEVSGEGGASVSIRAVQPSGTRNIGGLELNVNLVPERLRIGPWSVFAHLFVIGVGIFLVLLSPSAVATGGELKAPSPGEFLSMNPPGLFYLVGTFWCWFVLAYMFCFVGWGPMMSYTMWSWSLLTLRYTFATTGASGILWLAWTEWLAEALRFVALANACITFFLWWLILVPFIYYTQDAEGRRAFVKLNLSFFLMNIHVLNFPLALLDFLYNARTLILFDLWVALLVAWVYLTFYLYVLDKIGVHLYVILTPRTPLCALNYTLVLLIYVGIFAALNGITGSWSGTQAG
uniref:Uncharacterized protein n=1 Tax=Chromera velia CCMP2878 TaxID=1169474 RepID=A0A0G4IBC4_9ALVE|eukprot:Cvel_12703.t1-p1 / transcript=Cvel_12703.t1 / gene=Cvel_12703 / organism=Chromera_velia_CCMP2878 / gene_product=hypothetical protein / transcript_product=hypothetical protein / location=Cvel_scaffold842:9213-11386(-) / protein_length=321 / sequence_SO=supercontig / SO=protein_coding / is_pseudo=false